MNTKRILLLFILVMCIVSGAEANGNPSIRLGVMRFLTRSEGVTEQQAAAIGDIFARVLTNSPSLIVVERDRIDDIAKEHQLAMSGVFDDKDVVQLGKLMSCNYMLVGAVTNLERKVSETDLWLVSKKHQEVSAEIDVRVVDITTSKVIMAFSESGTSSRQGEGFNFYGIRSDMGKIFEGVEESAISEAVFRASFRIRENLAGERIQVVGITTKEITLNAGKNWGISEGGLFGIYSEGKEVINLDGTSMGRKLTLLAIVRITDSQRDFSYGQILKNGGAASSLRKGNRAEPLTKKEADELIKKKVLLKGSTGKKGTTKKNKH